MPPPPRRYDEPAGFWTFFFAAIAALIVYDLARLALAGAGVAMLVGSLGREPNAVTTPGYLPARPGLIEPAPAAPAALPIWNGPVTALRQQDSRACINGRVADRLDNGWQQHYDQRCQQATP